MNKAAIVDIGQTCTDATRQVYHERQIEADLIASGLSVCADSNERADVGVLQCGQDMGLLQKLIESDPVITEHFFYRHNLPVLFGGVAVRRHRVSSQSSFVDPA